MSLGGEDVLAVKVCCGLAVFRFSVAALALETPDEVLSFAVLTGVLAVLSCRPAAKAPPFGRLPFMAGDFAGAFFAVLAEAVFCVRSRGNAFDVACLLALAPCLASFFCFVAVAGLAFAIESFVALAASGFAGPAFFVFVGCFAFLAVGVPVERAFLLAEAVFVFLVSLVAIGLALMVALAVVAFVVTVLGFAAFPVLDFDNNLSFLADLWDFAGILTPGLLVATNPVRRYRRRHKVFVNTTGAEQAIMSDSLGGREPPCFRSIKLCRKLLHCNALFLALDGGGVFALAFRCGLFISFALAKFQ